MISAKKTWKEIIQTALHRLHSSNICHWWTLKWLILGVMDFHAVIFWFPSSILCCNRKKLHPSYTECIWGHWITAAVQTFCGFMTVSVPESDSDTISEQSYLVGLFYFVFLPLKIMVLLSWPHFYMYIDGVKAKHDKTGQMAAAPDSYGYLLHLLSWWDVFLLQSVSADQLNFCILFVQSRQ